MLCCVGEYLVDFEACADHCGRAAIASAGLLIVGQEFESLEVVCPDAQRSRSNVSADKVMAAVSARQLAHESSYALIQCHTL